MKLDYFLVRELLQYPKYQMGKIATDKLVEIYYVLNGDTHELELNFTYYTEFNV